EGASVDLQPGHRTDQPDQAGPPLPLTQITEAAPPTPAKERRSIYNQVTELTSRIKQDRRYR
ncbi:hypothetical protein QP735_07795, partial [Curtobacterium citreum]|uniref:hypothetical protein n=1 Tax=Curtobacterium citreum TaxID=2036 RepID=UPI002551B666